MAHTPTLFLILLCGLSGGAAAAQNPESRTIRQYTITLNGKPAGSMNTSALQNADTRDYNISYTINGNIVVDYSFTVNLKNRFHENVLSQGSIKRLLNKSVRDDNEVTRTATGYILREGKEKRAYNGRILHTVGEMYFIEPKPGLTQVFSEAYLKYLVLTRPAPGVYKTKLPNGGTLTYQYAGGILVKLIADLSMGEAVFTLSR